MSAPVTVWFVRHGEVASHRGDVPLTDRGRDGAEAAGERLARALGPGSIIEFCTPRPSARCRRSKHSGAECPAH